MDFVKFYLLGRNYKNSYYMLFKAMTNTNIFSINWKRRSSELISSKQNSSLLLMGINLTQTKQRSPFSLSRCLVSVI